MNFQGIAPLWLSGVRWNSSAALLVAFPSLFQLSSKNRNSPDPAPPPVRVSNPSETGNASLESELKGGKSGSFLLKKKPN